MEALKQNSNEWHEWRGKGIGASDVPILLGLSPYKTPLQLWEEKSGLVKKENSENFATSRGHALEKVAREMYALKTGLSPQPVSISHPELEFFRASLDGFDSETKTVLEIKCPGKDDHDIALAGRVPVKYFWQIQAQLFVAQAEKAHYWSFTGQDGVLLDVPRDDEAIEKLKAAGCEFWKRVQEKNPPEPSERDFVKVKDEKIKTLMADWKVTKQLMKDSEERLEAIRKEILAALPEHPRVECEGVQVVTYFKKGNVEYGKIPALEGMDLEPYRKKGSMITTFKEKKIE